MELYLCIIVYVAVLYVIKLARLDLTSNRIIFFFTAYWFIATILSIQKVAGLCAVSGYTYTLVYIHLISFVLGFLSIKINPNGTDTLSRDTIEKQIDKLIYNPLFIVVLLACTIYVTTL